MKELTCLWRGQKQEIEGRIPRVGEGEAGWGDGGRQLCLPSSLNSLFTTFSPLMMLLTVGLNALCHPSFKGKACAHSLHPWMTGGGWRPPCLDDTVTLSLDDAMVRPASWWLLHSTAGVQSLSRCWERAAAPFSFWEKLSINSNLCFDLLFFCVVSHLWPPEALLRCCPEQHYHHLAGECEPMLLQPVSDLPSICPPSPLSKLMPTLVQHPPLPLAKPMHPTLLVTFVQF